MDKLFINKKHEALARYAAYFYDISFDTFISICKGQHRFSVRTFYFEYDNEHYLTVRYPLNPVTFVLDKSHTITYHKSLKLYSDSIL